MKILKSFLKISFLILKEIKICRSILMFFKFKNKLKYLSHYYFRFLFKFVKSFFVILSVYSKYLA